MPLSSTSSRSAVLVRRLRQLAPLVAAGCLPALAFAQTSAPAASATPSAAREPAASLAPSFTQAPGLTPFDEISRSDLRLGARTDTLNALVSKLPFLNGPRAAIDDGTAHLPPFTLRGLSPDHTLVLVNGHRRHTTALLNVNNTIGRGSMSTSIVSVPLGALAEVEVLRDGSDARFASGALAGVVNLKLREDVGRGVSLFWGQTAEGDGEMKQVSFGAGAIIGRDGILNVTLSWRDRGAIDRALPDTRQQYLGTLTGTPTPVGISGAVGSGTGPAPVGVSFDPREASADREVQAYGDAASTEQALVFNSRLPLSSASELYFYGDFLHRRGESPAFFRRPGDSRVVRALWPNGFMPLLQARINDWSVGAGWRGRAAEWRHDVAVVAGSNTIAYDVENTNNATLGARSPRSFHAGKLGYAEAVVTVDLGRSVPLGFTKRADLGVGLEYRRENYRLHAGEDDSWRNGGVPIADGPDAGRFAPDGAQGFPGFRPADEADVVRNVAAASAQLSQEIGGRVLLLAAARYERAASAGETTDGKLAARVDLGAGVALRGSAGSTFRLPHLAQQHYAATATNFIGGVPFENRTFASNDPVARALGGTGLSPEHAHTMGAGMAWETKSGFGAALDFYRVDVSERLILSSNFIGSAVATYLRSQGVNGATGGRFFTNDAGTRTEGFDATLHGRWELGPKQRLTWRAAYNLNRSRVTHVGATPAGLAALGVTTPLFDLTEEIRLTRGQPRDNLRLGGTWEIDRWQITLGLSRFGSVEAVALTDATPDQIAALTPGYQVRAVTRELPRASGGQGGPVLGGPVTTTDVVQIFDPKWVTDFNVRLRLGERIRWAVGVSNLFDIYPTRNLESRIVGGRAYSGSDNGGTTPYSTTSPFGFNGAYYYSRLDLQF